MRRVCLAVLLCSVVAGSEAACLWQPTLKGLLAGTTSSWCTSLCEGDATVSACSLTSSALCQCDTTVLSDATVCDARRECDSSGFNCTSSACMAICSGMRSCQKGLFDCRSSAASGTCTLVCSGYQACTSLTSIPQDQIQEPDTGVGKKTGEIEALVSILPIASACSTQIQSASFSPSTHCGADTRECDIRCEGTESCQALHMQCDAKDSCEFSCTDIRSCKNSEYKCTGKGCKATCSGTEACAGSVMNWKDGDNMAKLDCMGTHSCMDATIECPTSGCVVRCGGFESCKGLTLKCPSNLASGKKCEIQCSGDWACTGVDNAHMCGEVSAVCSGYNACGQELRSKAIATEDSCTWGVTSMGTNKGHDDFSCGVVCGSRSSLTTVGCKVVTSNQHFAVAMSQCSNWGRKPEFLHLQLSNDCKVMCSQSTGGACSAYCQCVDALCECSGPAPDTPEAGGKPECEGHWESSSRYVNDEHCESTCATHGNSSICNDLCYCSITSSKDCPADEVTCSTTCSDLACQNTPYTCGVSECSFMCTSPESCTGAMYTCTGDKCSAQCNSYRSCSGVGLRLEGSKQRSGIDCSSVQSCLNADIKCPNTGCVVTCNGFESCKGLTLKCPSDIKQGSKCEIQCSGDSSCLGVFSSSLSGSVSVVCGGYGACNSNLLQHLGHKQLPTCKEYESTNSMVTAKLCDEVCHSDAQADLCQKSCSCKVYSSIPSVPPAVGTCTTWTMSPEGSKLGITDEYCKSVCRYKPDSDLCIGTGGAQLCACGDQVPPVVCYKWLPKTGGSVTEQDCIDGCSEPPSNLCKSVCEKKQVECPSTAAPVVPTLPPVITAVPGSCSSWIPILQASTINCNAVCNSPVTDVVCRPGQGVEQQCACVSSTIAPTDAPATLAPLTSCKHWEAIPGSNADCFTICNNATTESLCRDSSTLVTLCTCDTCQAWIPKSGVSQAVCNARCVEGFDYKLCHDACTCSGTPSTPVPTSEATLAPLPPGVSVYLSQVLRMGLRRVLGRFNTQEFEAAALQFLSEYVTGLSVKWVCPSQGCNNCPTTAVQKVRHGCINAGTAANGRGLRTLADATDSVVVEAVLTYKTGISQSVYESLLQTALADEVARGQQGQSSTQLGPYGVVSYALTDAEVVGSEPASTPIPTTRPPPSSSDDFDQWKIAVIAMGGVAFCLLIFACIVAARYSRSRSPPLEEEPPTSKQTENPLKL
eukprot:TRINITY_DN1416_c0_g2_i9.p1 TRINITY_DN1416_c0_g2~~TRINITY_DN1416_c0_g2_i9.p1  ORF type:complete len:1211 (+),score=204.92 TRINITY_DN1416_c0_g2_i9:37-3669(+)